MAKRFSIEGQDVCPATIGGVNIDFGFIKNLSGIYLCGMLILIDTRLLFTIYYYMIRRL